MSAGLATGVTPLSLFPRLNLVALNADPGAVIEVRGPTLGNRDHVVRLTVRAEVSAFVAQGSSPVLDDPDLCGAEADPSTSAAPSRGLGFRHGPTPGYADDSP